MAGNIECSSFTWKLCRKLVDEVVVVPEEAIGGAMRWALEMPHILLERIAALGTAALRPEIIESAGRNPAVVLTRGKLAPETRRACWDDPGRGARAIRGLAGGPTAARRSATPV